MSAKRRISSFALLVEDYDRAIEFYVSKLKFELLEDTVLTSEKRWVRVAPKGVETSIILAKADDENQTAMIGNQAAGRVWLFLQTDDFDRDYEQMVSKDIQFLEKPREEPYGKVVVFEDLYGNKWDLIEPC